MSRNSVALQEETRCCTYYYVCNQLDGLVAKYSEASRVQFYFLQHILVLLRVLPLKRPARARSHKAKKEPVDQPPSLFAHD